MAVRAVVIGGLAAALSILSLAAALSLRAALRVARVDLAQVLRTE